MDITVLIITRKRTGLLKRAIDSVKHQRFNGKIKTLVVIDDCPQTLNFLEQHYAGDDDVSWRYVSRTAAETSGPGRSAYLRNLGAEWADTEWVSFLDDDNEFETFHFSGLMQCALENNADAVFCYRQVFYADGTPYCFNDDVYPWARSPEQAKEQFQRLSALGIIKKGSNILRDQIDTSPGGINLVDTNVWLLKRMVLLNNKIPDVFSEQDWLNIVCEDDKMLQCLLDAGIKIFCNGIASVKYYLGGYSNSDFFNGTAAQNVYAEQWKAT